MVQGGRILGLTYDFYKKVGDKYVTTNGSNIASAGTANYYSFCGQVTKKDWISSSPSPLNTTKISNGSYLGGEMDASKDSSITVVYKDGSRKSGTLAVSDGMIMWGEGGLNIDFKASSGEMVSLVLPKRAAGLGCENPVKELSFSFWLK